jgi:hypothetical protein
MSNLATLKTELTNKLATSNTTFHTEAARTGAINEAIGNIAERYDVPELFRRSTLTIASGKCAIPTDMLRVVKIWDVTTPTIEYVYVPEDIFDGLADTSAYYWSVDYVLADLARKMLFKPTTITSAYLRYIKTPLVLSADTDSTELPTQFDDAILYGATAILLKNEASFERAMAMQQEADQMCIKAISAIKNVGGVKQGLRLRSRYEKTGILDNLQSS